MDLPDQPSESTKLRNPALFGDKVPAIQLQQGAVTFGTNSPPTAAQIEKMYAPQFAASFGGTAAERKYFSIRHEPVPAPRMTRSDKWKTGSKRRPCVQRYFDFRDVVRATVGDVATVPDQLNIIFYFPTPDSWSDKKQGAMIGKPHRSRPDLDNCIKAVQDSLFLEDGAVWRVMAEKRWTDLGHVELEMAWL